MENAVQIEGLTVSFGRGDAAFGAVRNLSLHIAKGKCLGIVGESGSGKSVTSLTLLGLHDAATTAIRAKTLRLSFNGEVIDLLHLRDKSWQEIRGRKVAMIFQEPMSSLNPVMRCGKQVTEALLRHFQMSAEEARARTIGLFEEVMLPDPQAVFDRYPHQLSGGQKQRVMIAMALSCNPELLIADEPTTALDVTVQKRILELLDRLRKDRNMSMLFITHDLGVVAEIADDVAVMRNGELVEYGEVKQVLNNPVADYTKGLMACRPVIGLRRRFLPTVHDFSPGVNAKEVFGRDRFRVWSAEESELRSRTLDQAGVLLKVEGLSVEYPTRSGEVFKALDGVSFELRRGETLGLVGESGCGKTTLSRCLLGLIPPASGSIRYDGIHLQREEDFIQQGLRKRMQLIFQDPMSSLNPKMSIGTALTEVMQVHKLAGNKSERWERAAQLLEQVGLNPEALSRYPHEFSGGQRQRIVIARALATEPEFIICDESVAALDVSVQAQVLNLLNDLKEQLGLTYIFITHDVSVVYHMSDRIMVMNRGKVEEINEAEMLVKNPQSDYTRRLLASVPGQKVAGKV